MISTMWQIDGYQYLHICKYLISVMLSYSIVQFYHLAAGKVTVVSL